MREIKNHIVNECNDKLKIEVLDEPGSGGACHAYEITGFETGTNKSLPGDGIQPKSKTLVLFQNGPIKEVGTNGLTHEALLAILEDRLQSFQSGPYACPENEQALMHVRCAQGALQSRTKARLNRGVEGTHKI